MLVLTRKVGEGIAIGDDVKIIVMQVKGKQVRLGIKASPNTPVHGEEVYQRIQDENAQASTTSADALGPASELIGDGQISPGTKSPLRRNVRKGESDN